MAADWQAKRSTSTYSMDGWWLIWPLFNDYMIPFWGLYDPFLWLYEPFLMIIWPLFNDYMTPFWWLYELFLMIIWPFFDNYMTRFWWLYDSDLMIKCPFLMTICPSFDDYMNRLGPRVNGGCKPLATEATGGLWGWPMSSSGRPTADMINS